LRADCAVVCAAATASAPDSDDVFPEDPFDSLWPMEDEDVELSGFDLGCDAPVVGDTFADCVPESAAVLRDELSRAMTESLFDIVLFGSTPVEELSVDIN
jgi:hypothetical protein